MVLTIHQITTKQILKSYFLRLSVFISKYKDLITKITLFTILIKFFGKIKLLRFIWKIISYILLSTFGIFISDIYGLKEIIAQIEYNWMNYVNYIHETKIYKVLIKIFHVVVDIDENKSEVIEDKSKIVENKSESNIVNSEIPSSEGQLKNEKIIHDKTSGGNEKENWLNKDLLILGLSIVSVGLIYIYWDSIIELFKNVKPDLGTDEDGGNTTNTPNFTTNQEEYEKYFKEIDTSQELYDLEVIRNQNRGKTIEYIEVEHEKWEDSPITPKASTSNLPKTERIMMPISRK